MAESEVEQRAAAAARKLVERLTERRCTMALAESCTAGLVADLVARASGASQALWGSFVCYTADAKERMLGIDGGLLRRHGPVSGETAREMALRALELSGASVAAAVTGLAGPLGDGSDTPVGTVWAAVALKAGEAACRAEKLHFAGTRAEVRMQAAAAVLDKLLAAADSPELKGLDKIG
jgi:PncC family amidohydrolase